MTNPETTKRLANALESRGSRPGKPGSNDGPTSGLDEVDASGAVIEAPPAPAPQPTQAERVFASANAMVRHFSPDANNVNIQINANSDVTFQRLADWLRVYASCLLAAAQAEQDANQKKE